VKLALELSPQKFIRTLYYVSLALLAASLAVSFWALFGNGDSFWFFTHNFDFDVKNNLPHVFKSLLLVFCAGAIFLNAREQARSGGPFVKRWWAMGWIFLWLAMDEEIQIHQQVVSPLIASLLGVQGEKAETKVFWIVPYLIFTVGFCLAYLGFWWKLPSRVRTLFAVGGVVYVGGAAIVEELAHLYSKHYGDTNVPYLLMTNFSEWMQMIGSIVFLQALLLFHSMHSRD
jgi:hypothetical protein